MISINDKSKCAGCSACLSICPKHCISWLVDNEGFWYPEVEKSECIDCRLCERVCPVGNDERVVRDTKSKQYAAHCKDNSIRRNSSSGGIFSLLAEFVLSHSGIVIGAAFDRDYHVHHCAIDNIDDLDKLRGSKYVQSDCENSFILVKKYLKSGKKVLFCGTPCQVNGLLNFIDEKLRCNLLTIDFVCHGVPSPKIFDKYLKEIRSKHSVNSISFRDKQFGWKAYSFKITFNNNTSYSKIYTHDHFMKMFLRNYVLRPSCYSCTQDHLSDVTLADYWGVSKIHPEIDDDKGTSRVMVNTEKGRVAFKSISDKLFFICDGFVYNKQKQRCVPKNRIGLFSDIDNLSFSQLYDKYIYRGFLSESRNDLKGYLKVLLHFIRMRR